ncbi:sulfatase, partial [Planctomycetota bacterium]
MNHDSRLLRFIAHFATKTIGLLVCFGVLQTATAIAARPNVVFITVDDMNCDSVGAYGCPLPGTTPAIDSLAASGMRFEHAHVTIAICQPTRAVWMTGRYPHRSGALGFDPIAPDVPTLVEALRASGYYTGILGKTTHVVPTRARAWNESTKMAQLGFGRDPKKYKDRTTEIIQNATDADQPFFIMANAHDPHRPFDGSKGSERKRASFNFPPPSKLYSANQVPIPGFLANLPDVRTEMAQYFRSVRRADQVVGAVLDAIEATGQVDNTIVVFKSDHGMPLPFAKTNCWRHSTRTPWIVRWPGVVKKGSHEIEHVISGIDLAPTILDAVGLPNLA